MAVLLTPTTELEAVNVCLTNIGERPVASLTGTLTVDAEHAHTILKQTTREVQTRGFYWNTEVEYTLLPNSEGKLQLPANTLTVDTTGTDFGDDLVQRGSFLYDRVNHTYTFDGPKVINLVIALNFDELPEAARRFITIRTARVFQERIIGSPQQAGFNQQDEYQAYASLVADELSITDHNMLTGMHSILGRY